MLPLCRHTYIWRSIPKPWRTVCIERSTGASDAFSRHTTSNLITSAAALSHQATSCTVCSIRLGVRHELLHRLQVPVVARLCPLQPVPRHLRQLRLPQHRLLCLRPTPLLRRPASGRLKLLCHVRTASGQAPIYIMSAK